MSGVVDLWAEGVYAATLEPRRRGPVRRLVVSALDLWCAMTGGTFELTRAGDVVVRRRADDLEVLRIPVRVADDAPVLLDQVRTDLRTSTPEAFRRQWDLASDRR